MFARFQIYVYICTKNALRTGEIVPCHWGNAWI